MSVYLVGAGPGDPGLLTVRAAELLANADVVIYDRLSVSAVLELVPDDAELLNVGKTPGGPSTSQDRINEMLIACAATHDTVVRLKGGDPFVFARGGEEAIALSAAGVGFEVVPGITSAIAVPAYAGIPVTQRHSSTSLTVVTGHEDPTRPDSSVDWEAIARVGGTIVILMGVGRIDEISAGLIAGGLPRSTPAAAIRWGTRPEQHTVRTTLADLADADLEPPSTIVVGEVAALDLDWYESRPLQGRSVVVTRPRLQAGALVDLLRRRGAHVVLQPAIEIESAPDQGAALAAALHDIDSYEWVVFTSANGVDAAMSEVRDARSLGGVSIAAVGSATVARLDRSGIAADLVPEVNTAEALADRFSPPPTPDAKVLLVRALEGREVVPDRLRSQGWQVDVVAAYQTSSRGDSIDADAVAAADVITFASPSAVDATVAGVGIDRLPPVVASIGPTTTAALGAHGIEDVIEADVHTAAGLVDQLEREL